MPDTMTDKKKINSFNCKEYIHLNKDLQKNLARSFRDNKSIRPYKSFIIYHQKLYPSFYINISPENLRKMTFIKVNSRFKDEPFLNLDRDLRKNSSKEIFVYDVSRFSEKKLKEKDLSRVKEPPFCNLPLKFILDSYAEHFNEHDAEKRFLRTQKPPQLSKFLIPKTLFKENVFNIKFNIIPKMN